MSALAQLNARLATYRVAIPDDKTSGALKLGGGSAGQLYVAKLQAMKQGID